MQNLNDMIDKNKITYENLYGRACELNKNSEEDFNNLLELTKRIPKVVNDEDKVELIRLLQSFELRLFSYESENTNIGIAVNNMETETNRLINNLGVLKPNETLSKNNLVQMTMDQIIILRDGTKTIENVIHNLNKMIRDIKAYVGNDNFDLEKMKEYVKSAVTAEIESIRNSIINCDKDNDEEVNKEIIEMMEINKNMIIEIKDYVDNSILKINNQLSGLKNIVSYCKDNGECYRDRLSELNDQLMNEISELKYDFATKIKEMGKVPEKIKRY